MDMRNAAARILGKRSDIITHRNLHPVLRDRIEASALRAFLTPRRSGSLANMGVVVGLVAEGRIARPIGRVVVGSGTAIGVEEAIKRLVVGNVRALLSFGLAGGLDPELQPGALLVPRAVLAGGARFPTDPNMVKALGGPTVDLLAAGYEVVRSPADKHALRRQTGAAAVDLESGAVARVARRHGLPFAVLRAVCDPAERSVPSAAMAALDHAGAIRAPKMLVSLAAAPSQIPALLALARDAALARRALIRRVAELNDRLAFV